MDATNYHYDENMAEPRYLKSSIYSDALKDSKMAFISGPRQVGKTTLAKSFINSVDENYHSWDDTDFKKQWAHSPLASIQGRTENIIVLDEIHKDRRWKGRLKGVYDKVGDQLGIIVTGSARLDLYRRGGDSLLGRYVPYRLHPFSVAESPNPKAPDAAFEETKPIHLWQDLLRLGGFPEPLFSQSENKARRWTKLRLERLLREDVRDLRVIQDLEALVLLAALLPDRVGSLLSVNSLREDVGVAYGTIYNWIKVLEALYHHFLVRPYSGKLTRALKAEPKLFLYDILGVEDSAQRLENLVALHLLKACHFWTDSAEGEFDLRFIRTKEKEEVDFCVLRDRKVWLLVECKSNQTSPSKHLVKFTALLKPKWSFQLVSPAGFDKFYPSQQVRVCSYEKFCAGLV